MKFFIVKNLLHYFYMLLFICLCSCVLSASPSNNDYKPSVSTIAAFLDKSSTVQNHSTEVSLTPVILIDFSKNVVLSSINKQSVKLQVSNDDGLVDYNLSASSDRVSINVNTPLNPDTKYKIILTNSISTSVGEHLQEHVFDFTTGHDIFPTAFLIYPIDASKNVVKHPIIHLQFSSQVDHIVKNQTIKLVDQAHELIKISDIKYDPELKLGDAVYKHVYTFSNIDELQPSTNYKIELSDDITDMAQNHLKSTVFDFFTNESNHPRLVSSVPHNNESGVSVSNIATITFSTAVQGAFDNAIALHKYTEDGPLVNGVIITSNDYKTFNLQLPALNSGTDYYISFDANKIKSIDTDDILLDQNTLHFKTGSDSSPTVRMSFPNDGDKDVSINAKLALTFSIAVSGANDKTIVLDDCRGNKSSIIVSTDNSAEFTIIPVSNFSYKSHYCVNVLAGITDKLNTAVHPVKFEFYTGDKTIPQVKMISKASNLEVNGVIAVEFSEAMKATTGSVQDHIKLIKYPGIPVEMKLNEVKDEKMYSFTTTTSMAYDSSYTVKIESDIFDASGSHIDETKLPFKTMSSIKLTPIMISSASEVDFNNPKISIQMTGADYDIGDFVKSDVKLVKLGNDKEVDFKFNATKVENNYIYDVIPSDSLDPSTKYKIFLSGKLIKIPYEILPTDFIFETEGAKIVAIAMQSWNYQYDQDPIISVFKIYNKDPDLVNDLEYITHNFIVTDKQNNSIAIPAEDIKVNILPDPDIYDGYPKLEIVIKKDNLVRGRYYLLKATGKASGKKFQFDPTYSYPFFAN